MSADSDTIAAICTAPGQAAIGIVRVSGPLSPAIADRLFHYRGPPPSAWPPNTFHYGRVKTADGAVLDEALLLMMRAPHSYTREDVAEFHIHGGRAALCAVLEAVINAGARPAAPGEFTKRAFLNGRLDLVQAEAVMDLISAGSARACKAAIEQLEGALSAKLSAVYDELVLAEAELEATLDFLAEETPEEAESDAGRRIASVLRQIEDLLATWREGRLLREGALVVIAGMPNAGKSTLLNTLLGSERAITAPTPGTTRDIIEETACFEGIPCRLADTAGIRTADCDIEREGVRRAKRYIAKADVLLYVVDAAAGLRDEDRSELAAADPLKTLLVLNKQDLGDNVHSLPALRTVRTCLLSGAGVGELKSAMCELLGTVPGMEPQAVISERHRARLAPAAEELRGALEILRTGDESMTAVVAAKVRLATEALGELLGRNFTDDLLDRVFSAFCVGK